MLEAAIWAPTGGNRQPWRVIAIKESRLKEELGRLYSEAWTPFAKRYRAAAPADETERWRFLRTLSAGDYLAANFGKVPVKMR